MVVSAARFTTPPFGLFDRMPLLPRYLSDDEVADFRERLCAAAVRMFIERGAHGFTMRQLASEVGCSPMTPYRYFKDKDEILAAVRATALNQFSDHLEAASANFTNARERATAIGDAYVSFALAHPEAYRLIFDIAQPDEERFPEVLKATARARRIMTGYIEALIKNGDLKGNPDVVGHVFWAAIHGVIVLHLAGKLSTRLDLETVRRETLRALARGFSGRSTT